MTKTWTENTAGPEHVSLLALLAGLAKGTTFETAPPNMLAITCCEKINLLDESRVTMPATSSAHVEDLPAEAAQNLKRRRCPCWFCIVWSRSVPCCYNTAGRHAIILKCCLLIRGPPRSAHFDGEEVFIVSRCAGKGNCHTFFEEDTRPAV